MPVWQSLPGCIDAWSKHLNKLSGIARVSIAAFVVASIGITIWLLIFDGLESVQALMLYINSKAQTARGDIRWLFLYACICVGSQLLVVPSGSLILIAAGFIFSPVTAVAIFFIAQILCSWPVHKIGVLVCSRYPDRFTSMTEQFKLAPDWQHAVQKEGFFAAIVLRLTPVIPSAAACLLAAGLGIGLRQFIPATIAAGWIRPLFFASVGGSLQALSAIPEALSSATTLKPLLLLFVAAVLLLLAKLVMRYKS